MEWLALFLAIGLVAGAVVWLAGRALRRRPADDEPDGDEGTEGPRHVDLAAMNGRELDDGSS
jgi:hypothetical protein